MLSGDSGLNCVAVQCGNNNLFLPSFAKVRNKGSFYHNDNFFGYKHFKVFVYVASYSFNSKYAIYFELVSVYQLLESVKWLYYHRFI